MRYFFNAAGRTFHVGSSRLTLKLFKLSELSCRNGFVTDWLGLGDSEEEPDRDFSGAEEVEGAGGCGCPFERVYGAISCSSCCGDEWGVSRSALVGDLAGLTY